MGRVPFPDLMHEWMQTLIQFGAGKKVHTPTLVREPEGKQQRPDKSEGRRIRLDDPQALDELLGD